MTDWLFWLLLVAALLVAASWVALWSFGRFARQARGAPSAAIPAGQGGELDRLIPDGPDGAALSFAADQALAIRLATARTAARSIDVMTYIWSGDHSGRMLAAELAEAAGRGVRVRILLDDVNLWGRDPPWLALDRVPGVEVRVFNPVRTRNAGLARGLEMLLLALRYNRRMHGKMWAVDGRMALIGGRNLGDVYFDLGRGRRRNVADADMLLTGAGPKGIVAQTAAVFDDFWNSGLALPIAALWRGRLPVMPGRRLATNGARGGAPATDLAALKDLLDRRQVGIRLQLIADPSDKALGHRPGPRGGRGWLPDRLIPVLASAGRSLVIATPYLVPGRAGMHELSAMARRGVAVTVLTNALAVIDHTVVHGAYRWYRPRLLAAGIRIFEYGDTHGDARMMHAKVALIDDATGYLGSFNFDLRSAWLNTELGVLFDDPQLLAETRSWLAEAMAPELAYAVERRGRWTVWRRGDGKRLHFEPESTPARRMLAFAVGHLPIHRLL